jgi:hypothetical protein
MRVYIVKFFTAAVRLVDKICNMPALGIQLRSGHGLLEGNMWWSLWF